MADIVFAPICSNCGLPIYMDIEIENLDYIKSLEATPGSRILHHMQINPSICPNCSTYFDSVIMPTRLPYEFPDDVKKIYVQPFQQHNPIISLINQNYKKD